MFLITWLLGGTVPTKKTIKTYEYKSPPLSLFERLFLDKFWAALPGAVYPPWLAPNVITLAGLPQPSPGMCNGHRNRSSTGNEK